MFKVYLTNLRETGITDNSQIAESEMTGDQRKEQKSEQKAPVDNKWYHLILFTF